MGSNNFLILNEGFNEENVYDSADYRTIYTLIGNTKQRSVGDLFKRALMAAYLLKILVSLATLCYQTFDVKFLSQCQEKSRTNERILDG